MQFAQGYRRSHWQSETQSAAHALVVSFSQEADAT